MSGIIKMVHRIDDEDGPYLTIGEVAEYFERSRDTIRTWGRSLGLPTHKMQLGEHENSFVWLYTEGDIEELKKHSETIKTGRPPNKS
jgi:hypothetical protein